MTLGPIKIIRPGATTTAGVVGPRGYTGTAGAPGTPGGVGPAALFPAVPWQTNVQYLSGPPTSLVTIGGSAYVCAGSHVSNVFATDLALGYWTLLVSIGANGATWYSGSGVPSSGVGVSGDYYLRTDTADIYNKVSGAWGSPILNIKGPTGFAVQSGSGVPSSSLGHDGDLYIDTINARLYGAKSAGAWPGTYISLVGPSGPGSGSVNPSGTIVGGHLAVFNNTSGTSISDGGAPGTAALLNVGTTTGTVAAGDDSRITAAVTQTQFAFAFVSGIIF